MDFRREPIVEDASDLLFYMALVLLPVDGTVAGISLPYWTPLSPWFFLAYAVANWRTSYSSILPLQNSPQDNRYPFSPSSLVQLR